MLKLAETEARGRSPDLVVASLGAIRKDKTVGVVTARVLFDGTNGIYVNRRTRTRIAADLKRLLRENSRRGRALTADVAEAHRQVPIHPRDWHMLGCQVRPGEAEHVHTVGTFGAASASCYWSRACHAVLCPKQSGHVACSCCGRFPPQGRRSRVSPRTPRLRCLCRRWGPSFLDKDRRR